MDKLYLSFNTIAPLFFLMIVGYFLSHCTSMCGESMLKKMNKLVFNVFLPCLLFNNVYQLDFLEDFDPSLASFVLLSSVLLFVILCLIIPRVVKSDRQKGVVIQALFRSEYAIFGMPIVIGLYGESHSATVAILSVVLVLLDNFLAVITFTLFNGHHHPADLKLTIKRLLKNPRILASVFGILVSISRIKFPVAVESTITSLAQLSVPMALLVLGGDLSLTDIKDSLKATYLITTVKLAVIPLIVVPAGILYGFRNSELLAILLIFQTPVAVSGYTMALHADADYKLTGHLVILTSAVCLPIMLTSIFLLQELGFM